MGDRELGVRLCLSCAVTLVSLGNAVTLPAAILTLLSRSYLSHADAFVTLTRFSCRPRSLGRSLKDVVVVRVLNIHSWTKSLSLGDMGAAGRGHQQPVGRPRCLCCPHITPELAQHHLRARRLTPPKPAQLAPPHLRPGSRNKA